MHQFLSQFPSFHTVNYKTVKFKQHDQVSVCSQTGLLIMHRTRRGLKCKSRWPTFISFQAFWWADGKWIGFVSPDCTEGHKAILTVHSAKARGDTWLFAEHVSSVCFTWRQSSFSLVLLHDPLIVEADVSLLLWEQKRPRVNATYSCTGLVSRCTPPENITVCNQNP